MIGTVTTVTCQCQFFVRRCASQALLSSVTRIFRKLLINLYISINFLLFIVMMTKSRKLISEQSVRECFIEIQGKGSFKSSVETNSSNDEDEGVSTVSNIGALAPRVKKNDRQSSDTSAENISIPQKEGLEDIKDSERSDITDNEILGKIRTVDEVGDDGDKSDYEAESFCSDDSYKGSEVTNVTARSSLSGCSSLLHSSGLKYDKRITDMIQSKRNADRRREKEGDDEDRFSMLESEMKYLSEEERTLIINRRQLTRSGRRNMSFTNEELRKIERENQLLLKKIMSHQKPQNKSVKPFSGAPRTSSSAINRKRQQKKIEEDNMILLRRIQQAKPCAMPRTSAPSFRLTGI